jgi:hypothetical protein
MSSRSSIECSTLTSGTSLLPAKISRLSRLLAKGDDVPSIYKEVMLTDIVCRYSLVLLSLLVSTGQGSGSDRRVAYSNELQSYEMAYDDQRLSGYDMQELVWLSPSYHPDKEGPYWVGYSSEIRNGLRVIDKTIQARPLEFGIDMPRAEMLIEPEFLERARSNIQRNRADLAHLESLKIPDVLIPVKSYLKASFLDSIAIEELRYEYIRTGDVEPLDKALCDRCPCGPAEREALSKLRNASGFSARRETSWSAWPTAMNRCDISRRETYPIQAWEAFLREFRISEKSEDRGPE